MARIVPQPDHRLGKTMMFIRQHTQAASAQQEIPSRRRFQPETPASKQAQEMTAGEKQDVILDRAHAFQHAICARSSLIGGFAAGTAVTKKLPIRSVLMNILCTAALIVAVVPFEQLAVGFS